MTGQLPHPPDYYTAHWSPNWAELEPWYVPPYLERRTYEELERAYSTLTAYEVLSSLKDFSPALVSTLRIGLAISGSDLDIICHLQTANAWKEFQNTIEAFKPQRGFSVRNSPTHLCCNFYLPVGESDEKVETIEVELYSSPTVISEQNAWGHLTMLHRCNLLFGQEFRNAVINLRQTNNLKMEPAAAKLLKLEGEPFQALLELMPLGPTELLAKIGQPRL